MKHLPHGHSDMHKEGLQPLAKGIQIPEKTCRGESHANKYPGLIIFSVLSTIPLHCINQTEARKPVSN